VCNQREIHRREKRGDNPTFHKRTFEQFGGREQIYDGKRKEIERDIYILKHDRSREGKTAERGSAVKEKEKRVHARNTFPSGGLTQKEEEEGVWKDWRGRKKRRLG